MFSDTYFQELFHEFLFKRKTMATASWLILFLILKENIKYLDKTEIASKLNLVEYSVWRSLNELASNGYIFKGVDKEGREFVKLNREKLVTE
jgi:hypothetical protein